MNILKLIGLTMAQVVKQALSIPRIISDAIKQRQQRTILNALEVERLDRIRNPSKYLGK
jgi:hypothetical protein